MRRRSLVLLPAALLLACSSRKREAPAKRYRLRGEVLRLEPERNIAVIKHEAIEGWMEAMTMEFPVRDKAEFAKLAKGRRIRATVNVRDFDYWLSDIHMDEPTRSASP
ncbi:MAG TPA: copper-binding protein [Bryobacteraceae bacterium]|nr:copper-binding protein [Bryobacteraceae bacterium]